MVGFLSSGAARGSGLSATEILGAREFVAAVIDNVVAVRFGGDVGTELRQLYRHDYGRKYEKGLQQPG